jgi:DNA ligase D-like protein (predicted 3'-phosphoesterase)
MMSRFVVHRHKTGKPHYDLRLVLNDVLRSWSLLKELPHRNGEKRLAIERESFEAGAAACTRFEEEAFGVGNVYVWDKGEVEITDSSARQLLLKFQGTRLSGRYELRRMRWYPGNRWLMQKMDNS